MFFFLFSKEIADSGVIHVDLENLAFVLTPEGDGRWFCVQIARIRSSIVPHVQGKHPWTMSYRCSFEDYIARTWHLFWRIKVMGDGAVSRLLGCALLFWCPRQTPMDNELSLFLWRLHRENLAFVLTHQGDGRWCCVQIARMRSSVLMPKANTHGQWVIAVPLKTASREPGICSDASRWWEMVLCPDC